MLVQVTSYRISKLFACAHFTFSPGELYLLTTVTVSKGSGRQPALRDLRICQVGQFWYSEGDTRALHLKSWPKLIACGSISAISIASRERLINSLTAGALYSSLLRGGELLDFTQVSLLKSLPRAVSAHATLLVRVAVRQVHITVL